jgi:RNA recognition motif-containing protein/exosome complex RNA-binding protein Csl4
MSESSIVIPGEVVAIESDWSAGVGVIAHNGNWTSTTTGHVHFNSDENKVSVICAGEGLRLVEIGDVVIAEVWKIRESMIESTILEIEGKEFRDLLPNQLVGQTHVTKFVNRYMHEARDGVRRRDIIRAKVSQVSPVIRLEMRDHNGCGVIHALCPQCGDTLQPNNEEDDWNVKCPTCSHTAFRVLSDGYGLGYDVVEGGSSKLNKPGKRWGKAAEDYFAMGPAARSTLIAADVRNDGSNVSLMNFGDGGGGRRGGAGGKGGRPQIKGFKLFVGGISRGVSTDQLKEAFAVHGKINDAIVMVDKDTGNNRGFGFVTFDSKEDSEKAISAMHKADFHGQRLTVNDADAGKKGGRDRPARPAGTRIYVGGLPWSMSDDGLKTLFANHGEVVDCKVISDRSTGRSKGFGFVTMKDADAKTAVSELDSYKIEGRTLKVQIATDKPRGGKDSGRGNRGGNERRGKDSSRENRGDNNRRGDGDNGRSSREERARREEGIGD